MENYKNARDLLKKHLFDKLMCERFGWEIRVGNNHFIVDTPLTLEENEEKIRTIEKIIRHLLYELDTYLFHIEVDHDYCNIPTIFHLLQMSIEFDDTPIDPDKVYEVDETELQRRPDLSYDSCLLCGKQNEASCQFSCNNMYKEDYERLFPHMPESVIKAVEKLAEHDRGEVDGK